jgi:uncharacterized protein YcfJ
MKKIIAIMIMVMASVVAYAANYTYYEYVPVINFEPEYREVTISTPHQECWEETVRTEDSDKVVGGVLGGTAGGILGHQVGGGRGKDVATVAGAIIGTIVGSNMADDGPNYKTVQRCRTVYDRRTERRKVGYKNYFEYNGKMLYKISKRPLNEVRVRVTISY